MEKNGQNKIPLTIGVFILLASIGTIYYLAQGDVAYSCSDKNQTVVGICFKLSDVNTDGLQTRCYYNSSAPTKYKSCNSGWKVFKQEIKGNETSIISYDELTQTVTISDYQFKDVAIIKLNTPIVNHVPYGAEFKVWEMNITGLENYSDIFGEMKIYNMNNGEEINRTIIYKIKSLENYSVNDYKEVCSSYLNGTEFCYNIINGSHIEQREIWIPLNKINLIKGENITIGGFAFVEKGDKVEWIPTMYGKEITNWASWTAALNVSLDHYYKFDDNILTDSMFTNNGTNTDTTNISGIINSGRYFFGSQYVNFSAESYDTSIFWSFWIRPNSTSCTGDGCVIYYAGTADTTVAEYITILGDEISYTFGAASGSNNIFRTTGADMVVGNWYHIIINGTGNAGTGKYDIWTNGVNRSVAFTSNGANRARPAGSQTSALGGGAYGGFVELTGSIDEFGKWNRTGTSAEVSDLYNGGAGLSFGGSSCTYSSGNWVILFSDYCNITSNVAAGAGVNNITITGIGIFTTTANITGFKNLKFSGTAGQSTVRCLNAGCFK